MCDAPVDFKLKDVVPLVVEVEPEASLTPKTEAVTIAGSVKFTSSL